MTDSPSKSGSATLARTGILVAALLLVSLAAYLAPGAGAAASDLVSGIDPDNPYFSGVAPGLLYVALPLAVLGAVVLVMSPGLLGVLAMGRGRDIWSWLLEGFVVSLLSISVAASALQAATGGPLAGAAFVTLVLVLACVAALGLYVRVARGRDTHWPLTTRRSVLILASMLAVPLLLLVALTPKLFWEAFNGDGTHAFLAAHLLYFQSLPVFPPEAGLIAAWPGANGLAEPYVPSWFMRLFGASEGGVRLAMLLYVPLLFSGVAALAEAGRGFELKPHALALIWASIVSFTLVMSFSATYDPYAADIAMPANHDFLLMIFCFGAMVAFANKDLPWLVVWTLLAMMTSPGSLPLLGLLLAAWFVSSRPLPWRAAIGYGLGLFACLLLVAAVPAALAAAGFELTGSEHTPAELFFSKFEYMAVADFERFLWVAVPCGIYPIVGLFGWRGWDTITRTLILLTFALFAMYYVVAVLSLHYFVPVMLLPLAIFWRKYGDMDMGRLPLAACWAGAALALWLGLPRGTGIYMATRTIGATIDASAVEGFDRVDPAAVNMTTILKELFSPGARIEVPDEAYGGSPLAWMYYATHESAEGTPKNYVLAPQSAAAPAGATRVAENDVAAAYVYDLDRWQSDRAYKPRSSRGKALYRVPRSVLFLQGEDSRRPGFFRARSVVARMLGRGKRDSSESP